MGLNAGLYVIPAEKFTAARTKGTWSRHAWHKCRPWFDIDKAWDEFDEVFQLRGEPLAFAIRGVFGSRPAVLDFAFVSPEAVAAIAKVLESTPTEDVVAEIERLRGQHWREDREGERGYYEGRFEELRKAYRAAAEKGAAIGVLIC